MPRRICLTIMISALIVINACSDKKGPTTSFTPAEPGILTLHLVTPNADDVALLLNISGPEMVTEVSLPADSSYVIYSRTQGTILRLAVFGSMSSGELAAISVSDINLVNNYTASLLEVADQNNALRTSLNGYDLTLSR